jgi:ABC-2 type transport system permease protein
MLKKYYATVSMSAAQAFDGNFLCVAADYAVRFIRFIILILVWRSLAAAGADFNGLTLNRILTYLLMASVLHQQLNIITPATSALWEGSIIGRYTRPIPVIGSFVAETVGRWWIPVFLFYSLPLWLASPLLGISPLPASPVCGFLSVLSLALSASLGFAIDILFAALAMRLKNGCWAALMVREALASLFSGALIPFAVMPCNLGKIFELLPFGSIANAPLSIYIGTGDTARLFLLQIFWNIALWLAALRIYRKSEERMISFGG